MSSGRQIVVRVASDGSVTAETLGMRGTSCLAAVPLLEELLEATATDSSYTADFHTAEVQTAAQPAAVSFESDDAVVLGLDEPR